MTKNRGNTVLFCVRKAKTKSEKRSFICGRSGEFEGKVNAPPLFPENLKS